MSRQLSSEVINATIWKVHFAVGACMKSIKADKGVSEVDRERSGKLKEVLR